MNPLLPLVITALGGAVAALIFQRLLAVLRKLWLDLSPIARYDCADQTTGPGCLRQRYGQRVDDPRAHNQQAYEHTATEIQPGKQHTIYGPYTNDFGSPGYHRVRFRIFGSGFSSTNDPVVVLDVLQAPFGSEQVYSIIGQRVVRAREFTAKYKWFSIFCYPAGSGVYEYRCSVVPGNFDSKRQTLRFDEIRVHRHVPAAQIL